MYKIEQGIDLPKTGNLRHGVYSETLETLLNCEVGDSFLIPLERIQELPDKSAKNFYGGIRHIANNYEYKIAIRKEYDDTEEYNHIGFRVWRIK